MFVRAVNWMEEITSQMRSTVPQKTAKLPLSPQKGQYTTGERLSVSAKAQALQNTPTVEQQEQQEDTQIQIQTLNKL